MCPLPVKPPPTGICAECENAHPIVEIVSHQRLSYVSDQFRHKPAVPLVAIQNRSFVVSLTEYYASISILRPDPGLRIVQEDLEL